MQLKRHWKIGTAALVGGLSALGVWSGVRQYLEVQRFPRPAEVVSSVKTSDVLLVDRAGRPLHEMRREDKLKRLHWVPLAKISPELLDFVVASEDRRFRQHKGVDYRALGGALRDYTLHGKRRGAKTISMKTATLIKGMRGERSRFARKFREALGAVHLEREWTKDEILEAYLNLAVFRGELVGVEAASRGLFHKEPHALTSLESSILSALLRDPSAPVETVVRRACAAHDAYQMEASEIDALESCAKIGDIAKAELGKPQRIEPEVAFAPFVARLLSLKTREGRLGGKAWRTTLDRDLQAFAKRVLAEHAKDGAVLVVENRTGDVLAYVGAAGAEAASPEIDAVQARREAGSLFQPFLYGLAFERRLLTPAAVKEDRPFELALEKRTLKLVGEEMFRRKLRDLGFTHVEAGDVDVSLWEVANAYRALAAGGVFSETHFLVDRAEERDLEGGRTPADSSAFLAREVYTPGIAFLVAGMLADREPQPRGFGFAEAPVTAVSPRFWTALKMDSGPDGRDHWSVGFSSRYTVAVWTGTFAEPAEGEVAPEALVNTAAPVWAEIMGYLHAEENTLAKLPPVGAVSAKIGPSEVKVPNRFPVGTRAEYFLGDTESRSAPVFPPGSATLPGFTAPAASARAAIAPNAPGMQAGKEEVIVRDRASVQALSPVRPAAKSSRLPSAVKGGSRSLPKIVWKKIAYPKDGMVVSMDPKMDDPAERLRFRMEPFDPKLVWYLNGEKLGPTARPQVWAPKRGSWRLTLRDTRGKLVDEVLFEVR